MADYEDLPTPDVTPVKLLDRVVGAPALTRPDGAAYHYDGHAILKKAGKEELILPRHVAIWFLQKDRDKVWTKDGQYVHRFALVDAEDTEVLNRCGSAVLDSDPIELDPARMEGWDITKSPLPRQGIAFTNLAGKDLAQVRALLNERVGGALAHVKGG